MLALATGFMIARFAIRTIRRRFFILEDILALSAWVFMVGLCGNSIAMAPLFRKTVEVSAGLRPPYPGIKYDAFYVKTGIYLNGVLYWCCLWSVKLALLIQCKRLIERQRTYTIIWWAILTYVVLAFIACWIPGFLLCDNPRDLLTNGESHTWLFQLFGRPISWLTMTKSRLRIKT
jgi:hypothetical protein